MDRITSSMQGGSPASSRAALNERQMASLVSTRTPSRS